jgi:hypothetical protein
MLNQKDSPSNQKNLNEIICIYDIKTVEEFKSSLKFLRKIHKNEIQKNNYYSITRIKEILSKKRNHAVFFNNKETYYFQLSSSLENIKKNIKALSVKELKLVLIVG